MSSTLAFATPEAARPAGTARSLRPAPRAGILGGLVLLVLVLAAVFAPLLVRVDPNVVDYARVAQGPSAAHWLGTDAIGRDMLARLLYGARVSLTVGLFAVVLALVIGVPLGLISGYLGGWVDDAIMRVLDVFLAFPTVLLAIAIVAILGPGTGNLILALGLTGWTEISRILRAEALSQRRLEYVEAARASGARPLRVMARHLLPNVAASVVVLATLRIGTAIVAEAGLSFLGLGVQPPEASWGTILADGRSYLRQAPHITTFAGVAIMVAVLATNIVGDAVRDWLDPWLKPRAA